MSLPLVSVIIPTYNSGRTLPRAIDSVLAQGVPNLEIIVVDDGSSDDTAERLQPYFRHIKYIKQPNAGSAWARNRGIENSTGEYIALLDADDEWLPGKLNYQLRVLERDRSLGLSGTGAVLIDSNLKPVDVISNSCIGDVFCRLLIFNPVVCSSVLLRRSHWEASGLRFAGSPSSMEDYALWLKLAARYRFHISPKLLVGYHLTATGKTCTRTIDQYRQHLHCVFEEARSDDVFSRRVRLEQTRTKTSVRLSVAREYRVRGLPALARAELASALLADWRAMTHRVFWNTLLWSGCLRTALIGLRRRVLVRVLAHP